jgi:uncharacterized protein
MSASTKQTLMAALAGLLFGAGLVISGMTDPNKVLGFLDVFGTWDASLMFVMIGAVSVSALGYRALRGRPTPWFASSFALPTRRDVDAKLLVGAAIFGIGWGLSGYCPGPSLVALPTLGKGVVVFVMGLAFGTWLAARLEQAFAAKRDAGSAQPSAAE